jgi:hypothetical protein
VEALWFSNDIKEMVSQLLPRVMDLTTGGRVATLTDFATVYLLGCSGWLVSWYAWAANGLFHGSELCLDPIDTFVSPPPTLSNAVPRNLQSSSPV